MWETYGGQTDDRGEGEGERESGEGKRVPKDMRGKGEGVDTVLGLGGTTYIGQSCMDVCVLNRKGYAQK